MTASRDTNVFDWQLAKARLSNVEHEVLGREQLREIFSERSRRLATPPAEISDASDRDYLCFMVGEARLALPLSHVRAVIAPRHITVIPCAPSHLSHVIYFGGRIVSLVDLITLLGLRGAKDKPSLTRQVVVVEHETRVLGVSTDALVGLTRFDPTQLLPNAHGQSTEYVDGIAKDVTLVLNTQRLVDGLRAHK